MPVHNSDLLTCRWGKCGRAGPYPNQEELFEHIDKTHNENYQSKKPGQFSCEWADCTYSSSHTNGKVLRAKHLITHTEYRPYSCAHAGCDSTFNRKDTLKNHVKNRHEEREAEDDGGSDADSEPVPFECKKCERTFDDAATLKLHNDVVHREARVQGGKKRQRADSEKEESTTAKKKRKTSSAASAAATSSKYSTILDVEDWSDDDGPPSTVVQDGDNDEEMAGVDKLVHTRLLAVEKRIARLETRLEMNAVE